ncbi:MAG: ABC transporter ATP-binding protein/permease, partial [Clostridia bacterium]|nr:ABC transporter ATP-binding protein/permease [Clostridia bacterium]
MITVFKNLKKRDWCYIVLCLGLIVLQVWLDLTMPDYTAKLAEAVTGGAPTMSAVWKNGGMMLACAFGSLAASLVCSFFGAQVAANLVKTLRSKLFDAILGFSNAEIDKFSTPSLITRTTNDLTQIQTLIAMGLQVIIKAPILAIWALCKISVTSIEWTAATLITVCAMIIVMAVLVGTCMPRFKKIQLLTDNLNDVTRENLSGVRVVRAFNAEAYQEEKFNQVNTQITKNHLMTSRTMGMMMPLISLCMNALTLAIFWIGAILINNLPAPDPASFMGPDGVFDPALLQANAEYLARAQTIGNMTAFAQYAMQVVMAFILLVMIFAILPRAMVSARRVSEVLNTKPSILYKDQPVEKQESGRIEFKNVSFGYSNEGTPCLNHLNFTIEKGQMFAIIGATGTGKTSLINLIPRFYDAGDGEVLIDGVNVKEYPEAQLEKMVSVAPQKAILFSGDIQSNVAYGSEEADEEQVQRALSIAQAEFVNDLEEGIHSKVAQGGTNFSGGQKQR